MYVATNRDVSYVTTFFSSTLQPLPRPSRPACRETELHRMTSPSQMMCVASWEVSAEPAERIELNADHAMAAHGGPDGYSPPRSLMSISASGGLDGSGPAACMAWPRLLAPAYCLAQNKER